MKNLLIASCLIMVLISCKKKTEDKLTSKKSTVSITYNKIKSIDSLRLLQPINGKYYYLFEGKANTIPTIKITIDEPQLIMLDNTTLFVAPNESYTINEINPYENSNEYKGENSAGQEFLNSMKTNYKISLAEQSIKKNTIEQGFKKIDSVFQIDYKRLDSLYSKKMVNTAFQETVKQKIDFDNAFTKSRALFRHFMRTVKDATNFQNEFNQNDIALFNKLHKEYPVNSTVNQNQRYWYDYTKYNICISNMINTKKSFEYSPDNQYKSHTNFLNTSKQLLNKESLEYFTACYLFENFLNYHYSKSLVSEYEQFKKEYPNSQYLPYLIKNIEVINEYPNRIKQPISSKIKFVENSGSINTLKKTIDLTKGKNAYLVFWSDDFSESKRDFNILFKYRPFFKKHNIDIVYLSLNELTNNENAKDIIHYYNLEGKHVSVSNELLDDIKLKTKMRGYPHYMIINKDGEIVEKEAVFPRRSNHFEKELIKKLAL